MAQEDAEAGLEPGSGLERPAPPRPAGVDGAALRRAIERVDADVAALSRLMAAQPEEVAARIDVDAATTAVAVRVGALGSALDQLRLSLLAGLQRTIDRLDQPSWLPELHAALRQLSSPRERDELRQDLSELAARVERAVVDQPGVLAAIADLAADRRLEGLTAVVNSLSERVGAGAAVADALEYLSERLTAVEATAERVGAGSRALAERLAPLPDQLGAIAAQIDRITPLARVGDEAGSLLGRLDRVSAGLEEVVAQISAAGLPLPERASGADGHDARSFEAVVEALADVTRRQDEVAAVITRVLDQVGRPPDVEAVVNRMEQQERALAGRLDRIDGELRRGRDMPNRSSAGATSDEGRALRAALDRLEQQMVGVLAGVARRQDELAVSVDRRLSAIESGLEAVNAGVRGASGSSTSAELAALRLAELRTERARVQAQLREERLLAAPPWDDEDLEDEV